MSFNTMLFLEKEWVPVVPTKKQEATKKFLPAAETLSTVAVPVPPPIQHTKAHVSTPQVLSNVSI